MRKLTIVVNCTDRKSVAPHPDLRVHSLPAGDLSMRFESWRRRVERAEESMQLLDLYRGETWLQAKALAEDARNEGFSVRMLVASAGLGLRDVTQMAPSYAATFAGNQADSVTDVKRVSEWWAHLGGLSRTSSMKEVARESALLVLSENYARAMDADLAALAELGGDHLLVGGWRTIEGLPRLPADRDLRTALGGTVSSLTLRMARSWMSRRTGGKLFTEEDRHKWSRWAGAVRRSELYERTPLSDDEVRSFIDDRLQEDPTLSATRALRLLRARGFACEQKRFGELFKIPSRHE